MLHLFRSILALRLWSVLVIVTVCVFLLIQPFDEKYRLLVLPASVGIGSLFVTINDLANQRGLRKDRRCHNCHRKDIEFPEIVENGFTRYLLCSDCPRKHHFLLRRGGFLISAVYVIVSLANPILFFTFFLFGIIGFCIIRKIYEDKLYARQGRCYKCKRRNATVMLRKGQYIPSYLVCCQCPDKIDEYVSSAY